MSEALLEEELEVIESIYGSRNDFEIPPFKLSFSFPNNYPELDAPLWNITSFPSIYSGELQREWEREVLQTVSTHFKSLFIAGSPCLFDYLTWFQEFVDGLDLPVESDCSKVEEVVSEEDKGKFHDGYLILEGCPEIFHSEEPLVERKSVFVAHVARIKSMKEIKLVQKTLLSNNRISRATHNISAYRIIKEGGVVIQDSDDDGEDAAGNRLLHLLQIANVENAYVCVSRWYGGVQLGPLRFKLINNCARSLLVKKNFIAK